MTTAGLEVSLALYSAHWVAVPGSVLREKPFLPGIPGYRASGIRTDRKTDQVRGTHSDLDKKKRKQKQTQGPRDYEDAREMVTEPWQRRTAGRRK